MYINGLAHYTYARRSNWRLHVSHSLNATSGDKQPLLVLQVGWNCIENEITLIYITRLGVRGRFKSFKQTCLFQHYYYFLFIWYENCTIEASLYCRLVYHSYQILSVYKILNDTVINYEFTHPYKLFAFIIIRKWLQKNI